MSVAQQAPTRRSLLSLAAGAGTLAVCGPAASLNAAGAIPRLRPWDHRLAAYRAALARSEGFNQSTYRPAWQRLVSIAGDQPPLSFTHTARSGHVATYRMTPSDMDEYAAIPIYARDAGAARDAWREWKARDDQAQHMVGWPAIEARQDALDSEEYRTQALLIAEPSPDHEALAFKLKIALTRVAGELQDEDRDALAADLERLGV